MKTINLKSVCIIAAVFIIGLAGGCDEAGRTGGKSPLIDSPTDLGTTIGSLATIYSPELVAVEG